MIVLKRKISTNELSVVNYPRFDMKPVEGLDKDIEYYLIRDDEFEYDKEMQHIVFTGYGLTKEVSKEFPHLKIAVRTFEIKDNEPFVDETEVRIKNLENVIEVLAKEKIERTSEDLKVIEKITGKISLTKNI